MRCLVTGSSGLLGSALAAELSRQHHRVVGLDARPGPWTTHLGSVTDRQLVDRLVANVDAALHTASLHAPHVGRASRGDFLAVNIGGTLNLLEAAAAHQLRRVVYTGSTSVYGGALVPTDRAVWATEALPPRPRDIYDITKLAAEELCADLHRDTRLPVICLRVGRFFPEPPETAAINRLGRGLDPRDAVAAHLAALADHAPPFGLYNIAARSPFTESDLAELLVDAPRVIGRHAPWAESAFAARGWRLPPAIDRVYVVDRAEAELGFRARYDFASLFP